MINLDLSHALLKEDLNKYSDKVKAAAEMLENKTGKGNDFLGWLDWPVNYDKEELDRILKISKKLKNEIDVLLVCGIGGSYLGARAAIEAINGLYPNKKVEIIYVGNTFSSNYLNQVIDYIKDKEFAVNCISKSGTTTETSIAFRIFKTIAEERYGKEKAKTRIIATTDKANGALKTLANKEGYETFVIPDDIGGRFSILTAVGLFPIAMADINVVDMLNGATKAREDYAINDIAKNNCYQYALARWLLGKQGYSAEMFVTYELQLAMLAEWWKQLYGESEGKEEKGILPTSATFSTDLHSLGQFIQEGSKVLFETVLQIKNPISDLLIPNDEDNLDNLNYLTGKSVDYVNKKAAEGTIDAHATIGKVPNIVLTLDSMDAYSFGYIVYFFEKACAVSVYLSDINPFDQPGVEVYKKNMFKLLGKPGV